MEGKVRECVLRAAVVVWSLVSGTEASVFIHDSPIHGYDFSRHFIVGSAIID